MTIRLPKKQWEPAKHNVSKRLRIAASKRVRVVSKAKAHAGEKK